MALHAWATVAVALPGTSVEVHPLAFALVGLGFMGLMSIRARGVLAFLTDLPLIRRWTPRIVIASALVWWLSVEIVVRLRPPGLEVPRGLLESVLMLPSLGLWAFAVSIGGVVGQWLAGLASDRTDMPLVLICVGMAVQAVAQRAGGAVGS